MIITLDDTSPIITYGPASGNGWQTQHGNDAKTWLYYKETVTATSVDSDYMTISFRSSGIKVIGAMKGDHGMFSTQLDDGRISFSLGYSAQEQFQATLFEARGLDPNVDHRLTLTNLPSRTSPPGKASAGIFWYLDIDAVILEVPQSETLYTTVYDNNSTSISYDGVWTPVPEASLTTELGASFTFPFNGSAVELRGALGIDHQTYSVQLDGGASQAYNGSFYRTENDATLYLATGLDESKPHTLKITNVGSTEAAVSVFELDRFIVNSTTPPLDHRGATIVPSDGQPDEGSSGGPNAGAIAGGVVGGVVALALGLFCLWFFCLRKRGREDNTEARDMVDARHEPPTIRAGSHFDAGEIVPFTKSHSQLDLAVPSLPATPSHQRSDTSTTLPMASTYVSTSTELASMMSPTSVTSPVSQGSLTFRPAPESPQAPDSASRGRYLSSIPAPPPSNVGSYLMTPAEGPARPSLAMSGLTSIPGPPHSDASSYPMTPSDTAPRPSLVMGSPPPGADSPGMPSRDSHASTTAAPSRHSTDLESMLKHGLEHSASPQTPDSAGSIGVTLGTGTPPWLKIETASPGRGRGPVDADGREIDAERIMGETLPPAYEQVPRDGPRGGQV